LGIQKKAGRPKVSSKEELTQEKESVIEAKERVKQMVKEKAADYLFAKPLLTKEERVGAIKKLQEDIDKILEEENVGQERRQKALVDLKELAEQEISKHILDTGQRMDGRQLDEIRPIKMSVGLLPRVHGSALFSRGQTQVLSAITLAAPGEELYIDTMEKEEKKRYMHHYNFPPFCSGEARPLRSTSRREIGHGNLVEKGLLPILPPQSDFPYTVRFVSEVLSSNGSTSMSSLCASVLSSMDAGIPISRPAAGIAIGLVSEENSKGFIRYKVLTDIEDFEDGPGGMDFKVIGTEQGITAIQLDTKTKGLTLAIVEEALQRAKQAREEIIAKMKAVLPGPRDHLSPWAPRVEIIHIDPEKIREVIGPGGKVINEIIDKTGATIDVEQDGTISVTSASEESLHKAIQWVKDITREIKVGEIFQARVTRILDFGAFAEIVPGQEGLIHVSELANRFIKHPRDVVEVGDIIPVKVIKVDQQGRIDLSHRAMEEGGEQRRPDRNKPRRDDRRKKYNHR